jgi:isoleucyl-tRNA synthetase
MLNESSEIRRRLKLLAQLVWEEAERNPEFAKALAELLAVQSTGEKPKKRAKTPALDPFEVFREKGIDGFRAWLNELSLEDLRNIVRQQRFDPSRLSDKWKTKERFVQLVLERVESRSKQGDVFRFYGQ